LGQGIKLPTAKPIVHGMMVLISHAWAFEELIICGRAVVSSLILGETAKAIIVFKGHIFDGAVEV
jgi:hypothetical protein